MTDAVGRTLAGRSPGVHLNSDGRRQADALGRRLSGESPSALYSSPLDRALQTAAPLSALTGLDVLTCGDATEIDFGDWTGRSLAELEDDARWRAFNRARSREACPGGESMADVQARMLRAVRTLCTGHPGGTVVLVSHADAIRAAICGLAGIPLDLCQRIDIDPASVSTVAIWNDWVVIRGLNR